MNGDHDRILGAVAGSHVALCRAPRAAAVVVDADGRRLADWGREATAETVFRIASMTKSFTAALVLALRDDGVLGLDVPVADLAPELAGVVGPGPDPVPLTLRHLLTMSSGLATDDPWADRHLDATDAELDGWLAAGLRFAHPTGTAFEYSNLGYALVGRVVHRVTGRRVQELVTGRLLAPLGLTRTAWTAAALPSGTDVAVGHHPVDGDPVPTEPLGDGVVAPMGGLWSCTADLGRWVSFLAAAWRADLAGADDAVLRAASRRELQQVQRMAPARRAVAADGSVRIAEGGYAMGLSSFAHDRLGTVVTHSGGLPGYGSNMRWVPGGVGTVVLASITYAPMWHAAAAVVDALAEAGLAWAYRPVGAEAVEGVEASGRALAVALLGLAGGGGPDRRVFADNVAPDVPWDLRRAEAVRRLRPDAVVVGVEVESGACGVVSFASEGAVRRVRFRLAPIAPALVQSYDWL